MEDLEKTSKAEKNQFSKKLLAVSDVNLLNSAFIFNFLDFSIFLK